MISDSLRVSFKTKLLKVIYTYLTPFVSVFAVICAVLCCFKSAEGKNSRTVSFICLLISFSVIAVIKLLNMLYSKKSLEYSNYQLKFAKRIDPQTLVPLSVLVILVVLPFYILVITSLKNSAEANFIRFTWWPKTGIDLESFKQLFTYASVIGVTIAEAILNSFIYAFIPTFVGLFVSALSAYAFAKLEFKKKNLFYSLLIMTMMMPGCVTMTTAYIMYERYGWTNTVLPLIVPGCFGSAATVMFLREYFIGITDGMLEAAKIDCSGKWRCFSKIMIPLGKPALIAQFILGFITAYNDFITPLIYLNEPRRYTIQVALDFLNGAIPDQTLIASASVFSLAPMLLLYIIFQKRIINGISMSSGLKG